MQSWKNTPSVIVGYAEAIIASAEWESERGRTGKPRVNGGLAAYISQAPGLRAVGGMILAEELTGSRPSAQQVAEARASGKWVSYHEESNSWYVE